MKPSIQSVIGGAAPGSVSAPADLAGRVRPVGPGADGLPRKREFAVRSAEGLPTSPGGGGAAAAAEDVAAVVHAEEQAYQRFCKAAQGLELGEAELRDVHALVLSFRSEAIGFDDLPSEVRAPLLRERASEVLLAIEARIGTPRYRHLLSRDALRPVAENVYRSRPTVYPPPSPDR